jgi:hypothetical protein
MCCCHSKYGNSLSDGILFRHATKDLTAMDNVFVIPPR